MSGLDIRSLYVPIRNDRPTRDLAHADHQTDGKTGRRSYPGAGALRLWRRPSPPSIGIRCSKTLAPRPMAPRCDNDVIQKFSATCCASPGAVASGPWKFRPPMQFDCMAARPFGRTSRSGCPGKFSPAMWVGRCRACRQAHGVAHAALAALMIVGVGLPAHFRIQLSPCWKF
jgi:hypothetical protein